mmetsp:Transcript_15236/g.35313  ORF Transcript_15236/g.35313 Transcript_15236/m.35313 type:complete len:246 (-) Transcript_15236:133-870(-)
MQKGRLRRRLRWRLLRRRRRSSRLSRRRHPAGRSVEELGRRTVSHVGWRGWPSPLLLVLGRTAAVLVGSSSSVIPSSAVVVVVVVTVAVVSHPAPVHVTPAVRGTSAAARGRRDEPGPDPAPVAGLLVVVEGDPGALVGVLLPSLRKGRDHRIVLAPGADVPLLGRGQPHPSLLPLHDVLLVVKLEVLAELPTPTLLLAAGGAVVRQVRVGVVVEKAGHYGESRNRGIGESRDRGIEEPIFRRVR